MKLHPARAGLRRGSELLGRTLVEMARPGSAIRFERMSSLRHPMSHEEFGATMASILVSNTPFLVGRFGQTELQILQQEKSKEIRGRRYSIIDALACGDPYFYFYGAKARMELAGLKPLDPHARRRYTELVSESTQVVDILASWFPLEGWFTEELHGAKIVELPALEPFRGSLWTSGLEGKKVLVVHPYADLIFSQYSSNRAKIFRNERILPSFSLQVFQPLNAYEGEVANADSWFAGLESMKAEIRELDFDVALIGAGPFGLPLGAAIKESGRQAVVTGGATQLIFGIWGKRWQADSEVVKIRNSSWTTPYNSVGSQVKKRVDRGAYW